jgi:hypothetical protein
VRYLKLYALNRRRWFFALLLLVLALAAWRSLEWLKVSNSGVPVPPALVLAPWLATAGWALTVYMTRGNERRKTTIDLLLRQQMDRCIEDHKNRILDVYKPFTSLDSGDGAELLRQYRAWEKHPSQRDDDTIPVAYSVIQILNQYEFLAVNIRRERLDEGIAYETARSLTKNMVAKFATFIKLVRAPGEDGHRPTTYCHLVWLTKRWHEVDLDT